MRTTESQDGLELRPDEYPGEQWTPSNGDDGHSCQEDFCSNCQRDKVLNGEVVMGFEKDGDLCEIVGASYRGEAKEWRRVDGKVTCISFLPVGEKAVTRCPHTLELPL